MTPADLQSKLDDAKDGPRFGKRPRELGQLKDDYRAPPLVPYDPINMAKAHLRCLSVTEWRQIAHVLRRGRVLRLCNDDVLAALLKLWAES